MLLPDTGDWQSSHGSLSTVLCKWSLVLSMTSVGLKAIAGDRVASISGVGCKSEVDKPIKQLHLSRKILIR